MSWACSCYTIAVLSYCVLVFLAYKALRSFDSAYNYISCITAVMMIMLVLLLFAPKIMFVCTFIFFLF